MGINSRLNDSLDTRPREGYSAPHARGSVTTGAPIQVQTPDRSILDEISRWGGARIQKEAEKQYNADLLAGQMTKMQGKAFDELPSAGNKWQIEGYRLMEAQEVTSSLMNAQEADIEYSSYAEDPTEYREKFVRRAEAMLEDQDPRTQELVREQLAKQVPVLADRHMKLNAAYSQERTMAAAVSAINTVSMDDTADEALNALVSDSPDGPLGALGPRERQAAIANGVAASFQDMNPKAYIKLKASGALDKLDPDKRAMIDQARQGWQSRIRNEANTKRAKDHAKFEDDLENGRFPTAFDAMEAYSSMEAEYGIETTFDEGARVMAASREGIEVREATTGLVIKEHMLNGDYSSAARLVGTALAEVESSGNYRAIGPAVARKGGRIDRAHGKYQVMGDNIPSWTREHLGRELTPAEFLADEAAQDAVYFGEFAKNLKKYGSVEDAISVWHSGRPMSKSGEAHDGNMATHDYVNKIMNKLGGSPKSRMKEAEGRIKALQDSKAGEDYYQFRFAQNDLNNQLEAGTMDFPTWEGKQKALFEKFNQEITPNSMASLVAASNAAVDSARKRADSISDPATRERYMDSSAEIAQAQAKMIGAISSKSATPEQRNKAIDDFMATREESLLRHNIPQGLRDDQQVAQQLSGWYSKAATAAEPNYERNMRELGASVLSGFNAMMREKTAMDAINNGTAGMNTGIARGDIDKAFTRKVNDIKVEAQRLRNRDPNMTDDDEADFVQAKTMELISTSGHVPMTMKAAYSSRLTGNMLDRNGNAEEASVSAVQDYAQLKSLNPTVAKELLSDHAQIVAEAALNAVGGDARQVPFAIKQIAGSAALIPGAVSPAKFVAEPEMQEAITKAVTEHTTQSTLSWIFNGFQSPEGWGAGMQDPNWQAGLKRAIEDQVARDYVTAGGAISADKLSKHSAKKVFDRMTILNGDPWINPTGLNLTDELFGRGSGTTGVRHTLGDRFEQASNGTSDTATGIGPEAADKAIRSYLFDNAGRLGTGIPEGIARPYLTTDAEGNTIRTGSDPSLIGRAADNVIGGLTLGQYTQDDAHKRAITYTAGDMWSTDQGSFLRVFLDTPDGNVSPVTIPLKEAGRNYLKQSTDRINNAPTSAGAHARTGLAYIADKAAPTVDAAAPILDRLINLPNITP